MSVRGFFWGGVLLGGGIITYKIALQEWKLEGAQSRGKEDCRLLLEKVELGSGGQINEDVSLALT